MISDKCVQEYFKTVRYRINPNLLKQFLNRKGNRYDNCIWNYVNNRYSDSHSWTESLVRIVLGIEKRPVCKECKKEIDFKYNLGYKCFNEFCSYHCQMIYLNKAKKINTASAIKKQKTNREKTMIKKYGVDNPYKLDEVKKRVKNTFIAKYGVDNPFKKKELFDYKKQYQHQVDTKRKNHTFNTSLIEEELYLYIKERFPDVERQYKDSNRYPFLCDFYIPSLDYFIELEGHWTHGNHPYTENSIEDQKKVEEWKSKHTKYYDNAIRTWTILDIHKRATAINNNLNYKEVWSLDEGKKFIDTLK